MAERHREPDRGMAIMAAVAVMAWATATRTFLCWAASDRNQSLQLTVIMNLRYSSHAIIMLTSTEERRRMCLICAIACESKSGLMAWSFAGGHGLFHRMPAPPGAARPPDVRHANLGGSDQSNDNQHKSIGRQKAAAFHRGSTLHKAQIISDRQTRARIFNGRFAVNIDIDEREVIALPAIPSVGIATAPRTFTRK